MALLAAGFLGGLTGVQSAMLYDNTSQYLTSFVPGTSEVADEITLASGGNSALITYFAFQYFASDNIGDGAKAQVRFYDNNGPVYVGSRRAPGAIIWNSGQFPITPTTGQILYFDVDFGAGVPVPATFTWSVQFFDLASGSEAGLDVYGPVGTGSSASDYWFRSGTPGAWVLATDGSFPPTAINFAAQFQGEVDLAPVPEPAVTGSLFAAGLLAACAGHALRRHRRNAPNSAEATPEVAHDH